MTRYTIAMLLLCGIWTQAHAAGSVQFSSKYTDFSKDCKWSFKESELHEGQDNDRTCRGYDGYYLGFDFAASSTGLWASKQDEDFTSAPAIVISSATKGMVEWRMANKKPFAIIVRSTGSDMNGNKGSERLVIRGLIGFESIKASVNVKNNSHANEEARSVADSAYIKIQASMPKALALTPNKLSKQDIHPSTQH